jgi:hypothetical protein
MAPNLVSCLVCDRFVAGIKVSWVAGLCQRGKGTIHRQRILIGGNASRSHANFLDLQAVGPGESLAHPANTRTAMHSINTQCKFGHDFTCTD